MQELAFEAYKAQFMNAATVDELNEWYQYFHMLLPKKEDEEAPEDGRVVQKRPKRASKCDPTFQVSTDPLDRPVLLLLQAFCDVKNTCALQNFMLPVMQCCAIRTLTGEAQARGPSNPTLKDRTCVYCVGTRRWWILE